MVPEFTTNGSLPKGIHTATWAEFVERYNFSARRKAILDRVVVALQHLASGGVQRVFVGGSFVTAKKAPKDMDVVIDTNGANPAVIHPMFIDLSAGRVMTLSLFGAEFFPMWLIEGRSNLTMIDFMQMSRDGIAVGVVEIDLQTLPEPEDDDD